MSLKDFQFLGKLGEGAYSSVYKAKRLIDNQIYAIKKVKLNNLNQRQKQNALNQARILASIHHPNIVSYKQSFIQQSTNYLYIIMQFADYGDLYEKVVFHTKNGTRFSQEEVWSILIQITRGLKALHQLKIMHRDLKSANVFMYNDGSIKLGDMNVSKVSKSMCKTQTGTPYYASPEVWKDQPYDRKSDIWSLGCVIYEAITLKPPFRANDMEGLFKKVTRGFYPHIPEGYSQELTIVLKTMLQVTPHLRSTCDRILELPIVMKHNSCLPGHLQSDQTAKNHLLQTIKLRLDEKEQLSVPMPKPRYLATIDVPEKVKKKVVNEDQNLKDFHNVELRRELDVEKFQLPRINDSKRQKIHSDVGHGRRYQKETIVHRLMEPIRVEQQFRMKGGSKSHKYKSKHKQIEKDKMEMSIERKMPSMLQGKLRSLSPDVIARILQKEKEKQRVYSIIGSSH